MPSCVGRIYDVAYQLRDASRRTDAQLVMITARQAPVAGDLRLVLTLLQVAQHQGQIADLFELIADQVQAIGTDRRGRPETAQRLAEMARLAGEQLHRTLRAFVSRDVVVARSIHRDDDAIDRLNRAVFEATLSLEAGPSDRELALRQVLIARSLERIGDNAVDIAEQLAFLVTKELREFSDASHPRRPPTPAR